MTPEQEYAIRSKLKWRREGADWALLHWPPTPGTRSTGQPTNSPDRQEGYSLGKVAASGHGSNRSECNSWQALAAEDTTAIALQNIGLLLDGYTGSGRNRLILSRTAGLRRPDKHTRGRHVENFAGFKRVRASGYSRFISCSYRCCICGDAGANPCCSWPDSRSRAFSDRSNRLWRLLARSTLSSDAPPMILCGLRDKSRP
jgi:hypothetical protein